MFTLGPFRHWGDWMAPQWQQGPVRSCLVFFLLLLALFVGLDVTAGAAKEGAPWEAGL